MAVVVVVLLRLHEKGFAYPFKAVYKFLYF